MSARFWTEDETTVVTRLRPDETTVGEEDRDAEAYLSDISRLLLATLDRVGGCESLRRAEW